MNLTINIRQARKYFCDCACMCAVQPQGITLWGTERGMPHSLIFFFNKARFHTAYIYPTVYICFENKMICCTCTAHAFVRCACQHIKCVAHRHGYKQSMGQCNTFASCQYLSSLPQNFYNLLKVRLCITWPERHQPVNGEPVSCLCPANAPTCVCVNCQQESKHS